MLGRQTDTATLFTACESHGLPRMAHLTARKPHCPPCCSSPEAELVQSNGNGIFWPGNISHFSHQTEYKTLRNHACCLSGTVLRFPVRSLRERLGDPGGAIQSYRMGSFRIRSLFAWAEQWWQMIAPSQTWLKVLQCRHLWWIQLAFLTLRFTFTLNQQGSHVLNSASILLQVFSSPGD